MICYAESYENVILFMYSSRYFISNFPSLTTDDISKDDRIGFDHSEPNKVKVSLEDDVLQISGMNLEHETDESQNYEKMMKLLGVNDADRIISISNLSFQSLKLHARKNNIRELHYYILPNFEDSEGDLPVHQNRKNYTNSEVKESIKHILNNLEIADCVLRKHDINKLGDDFEALVESGKIVKIKDKLSLKDKIKHTSFVGFSAIFFITAMLMNIFVLSIFMKRGSPSPLPGVLEIRKIVLGNQKVQS